MQRTFDVKAVRDQFPALGRTHNGRGVVFFDGPGGSQVARQAIEAITGYMERGGANLHGVFPTSAETEEILADTHKAAADFHGTAPDGVRKTPTIAFRVEGHTPEEVCMRMLEHGFFIAAGDFYASTLAEKIGIGDSGGFIRAGLAPYNTEDEVEKFVQALDGIVRET
jgi:selenocysteine lyase/cysteine desulfurase